MLRFSKWSFLVILQFFLLIIMTVWNIKQTIVKNCNIQKFVILILSMNAVRSLSPAHTRSPMWVIWKIFIYNLLWLAEYQCKDVVKFNLSDLFFRVQLRRSWKRLNWKNLLLTLIAVTRIINLVRCISQFKCFKFPIYIFYFRPALFFKRQVICWDEQYS